MELIHTCYRITEIDRSVAFYEALGFEERARMPIREEAINVFMGLPGDGDRLELTYNFGVDSYEVGTGYGHIAITVDDMDGTLAAPGRAGDRPGAAQVPGPRGRLLHRLRPRSRRLPGRADRKTPAVLTTKARRRPQSSRSASAPSRSTSPRSWSRLRASFATTSRSARQSTKRVTSRSVSIEQAPTAGYLGAVGSTRRGS